MTTKLSTEASVPFVYRLALVITLTTLNSLGYLIINTFPTRQPRVLPLTPVDHWLGWHAWSIWPYWFMLLLGPLLALSIRQRYLLWATVRAYALALGINMTIWLLWPTCILRHPLPVDAGTATLGAWRLLYALDQPNACFPSGHITIPFVIAAGVMVQYPAARRWLWLWLLLIPSVVTTGQHYAWDIVGGLITASISLIITRHPFIRLILPFRDNNQKIEP
ncbi:MAG: phosphatase PAP2 family protein [Xanthomonadaceae bacterium]|nr:phosphatase PAP2 family protein [Xanthomonadaceae bacterium]